MTFRRFTAVLALTSVLSLPMVGCAGVNVSTPAGTSAALLTSQEYLAKVQVELLDILAEAGQLRARAKSIELRLHTNGVLSQAQHEAFLAADAKLVAAVDKLLAVMAQADVTVAKLAEGVNSAIATTVEWLQINPNDPWSSVLGILEATLRTALRFLR
jgi:hypothetical protein